MAAYAPEPRRLAGQPERLIGRHFVAQHERPAGVASIPVGSLSAHHRVLLVTDGTVGTVLEAAALEAVVADQVDQREVPAPDGGPATWLGVPAGTPLVRRRVVLRGDPSGTPYVSAESLLAVHRLPPGFTTVLDRTPGGIGAVLLASAAESRRELLWFGRPDGLPWPGHPPEPVLVSRAYRLILGGESTALITENLLC